MKGGSEYASSDYYMWFYLDDNGFDEGDYDTRDIESHGESGDAFMAFGVDTETWAYGEQQVEFGLLESHRIRITSSGVYVWTAGDVWEDILGLGGASNLGELGDVVITGTPADNELLAWDTSTSKWINQTASEAGIETHTEDHDNTHHTTNYHTESDGTGVVTVHSDITSAGSGDIITTVERGNLHSDVVTTNAHVQALSINNLSEDSSPQLGGDLDLNDNSITVNGDLGTDHYYEGLVLNNITNAQAFGKLVYITSAHTTALCDKDSIELAMGISVGTGEVLYSGTIRDDSFSGLAAGNPVYVGDDGNPTDDISAYATGDMVQCIGVAIDTNVILIKDICWVEIV